MFVYIRARFRFALIGGNLKAQSTGSHRGIESGIQIPETWLQALLPPSPRAARALLRARSQAKLSPKFQTVPNWNYFTVVTRQFLMEVSMF